MAIKPVRVSQVNSFIKRILQTDPLLGNISVIGEVSNLKYHSTGHVYFTLKDENSKLSCFLAKEQLQFLHYQLEEGMEITASGYIYVYERGGTYSLNVRDVLVEGQGNLAIAFEKLKAKLEKEGLFEEKYKKKLPAYPRQVAVVTSETGAAVRDIVKIISSKNDQVRILIYPCLVQGQGAAADIAGAIAEVNRLFPETDVMIVGRGGGSAEELWAFNEEIVARAIFLSEIPVISAVGHETDVTIADYVADKRAATPTNAADLAVPDKEKLLGSAAEHALTLQRGITEQIKARESKVQLQDLGILKNRLLDRLILSGLRVDALWAGLESGAKNYLVTAEGKTEKAKLDLLMASPLAMMEKGYGMILDETGRIASSVKGFAPADSLTVIFKDGKINCRVETVERSKNETKI